MKSTINPGLLHAKIDKKWQENDNVPFGTLPDERWAVHFEVTLYDKLEKLYSTSQKLRVLNHAIHHYLAQPTIVMVRLDIFSDF